MAGNNITVAAASDKFESAEGSNKKSSGLLSGGGFGFTIGTRELDNKSTSVSTTAVSSNVGSIDGNVSIKAGNGYTQSGSNVLAPKGDIDVVAKQISILAAAETERSTQDMVFKQSGLTIQITSPVLSAIQTAQQMAQAAKSTKDGRMQLLAAANIGFAGKNAYDAVKTGQGFAVDGKDNPQIRTNALDENGNAKLGADKNPETRDATSADKVGGINLAISIGASKSENHTQASASTARGSTLNAGGNISLTAQGGGADSNLIVQGSDIKSGADTLLKADNEVRLLAAQSTTEQHSSNKAMSGSVGISIGTDGLLFNAGLSGSRGRGDGSDVAQVNTHVDAGNKLTIASGTDTTIKGAVASGKQVVIDVGTSGSGNLNIESLQDTSTYKSRQQSAGVSISAGMGRMSGSLNLARSSVDGNYASVNEQSGIKAGDEGFQIKVAGNTDLKGAKIASTDKAVADGKNQFQTASLTMSDIQNRSEYKAESQSVSAGGGYGGGKTSLNGTGVGFANESGSDASVTKSGISGIAGDTTVRSDKDSSNALVKNWNAQELQADVEAQAKIMEAFGKQAALGIGTYASLQYKKALDAGDAEGIENWKEGGAYRTALHAAAGALGGGLAGAAGATVSSVSMPEIAKVIGDLNVPDAVKLALGQVASAALGAAVGGAQGMSSAVSVEANNRQLHEDSKAKEKTLAKGLAEKSNGKYTTEQIENALRSANNKKLGETILTGSVIALNGSTPANSIYDTRGMVLVSDTQGNNYLVQTGLQNTPPSDLRDYIAANTAGTYTWSNTVSSSSGNIPAVNPFSSGWNTGEMSAGIGTPGLPSPDYLSIQGGAFGANVNLAVNLHDGTVFFGGGGNVPISTSVSINAGFLPANYGLSSGDKAVNTSGFLQGAGASASGCLFVVCVGGNHSFGGGWSGTSVEIGVGSGFSAGTGAAVEAGTPIRKN